MGSGGFWCGGATQCVGQGSGGEFLSQAFLLGIEMLTPCGVGLDRQFELFARRQRFVGMGVQRLDQELKADVFAKVAFLAAAALLEVVPGVASCGTNLAFDSRAQRIGKTGGSKTAKQGAAKQGAGPY